MPEILTPLNAKNSPEDLFLKEASGVMVKVLSHDVAAVTPWPNSTGAELLRFIFDAKVELKTKIALIADRDKKGLVQRLLSFEGSRGSSKY